MPAPRRIFVAWDRDVETLRLPLERLDAAPNLQRQDDDPVLSVEVPMLGEKSGDLWDDYVAAEIERADGLLAFVDTPNANVALEVGYALGRGIEVWLARHAESLPAWTDQEPFRRQLLRRVGDATVARATLRGRYGPGIRVRGVPSAGHRTLVLCPGGERTRSGPGRDVREVLAELDVAPFEPLGASFSTFPERLAEVGRVVWIVLAYPAGEDVRDGRENAALAAVAGFLHAHDRELVVLRQKFARKVADVDLECREWGNEQELRDLLRACVPREEPPSLPTGDAVARYREHLARWNDRLVPFFGSPTSKRMAEVYVERRVAEEHDPDAPEMGAAEGRGRAERLDRLVETHGTAGSGTGGRWLVVGAPGSGKTTLLRRLSAQLAARADGPVPVLLSLAHLAATRRAPLDVAEEDLRGEAPGLARELASLAQDGRVWLLLDGLDEVRGRDLLDLPAMIGGFHSQFRRCPIVVTTRDEGRRDLGLAFEDLRLLDLDPEDAGGLVESWVPGHGKAIWAAIEQHANLRVLARNPWMLTLMAKLALDDGTLPPRRIELFERAVDLLLRRGIDEDADSGARGVLDPDAAADLVGPLALRLQEEGGEQWTRRELCRHVRRCEQDPVLPHFREDREHAWPTPGHFVDDLGGRSGLLAPRRGPSQPWEFVHRSLREYLAAKGWSARVQHAQHASEPLELCRKLAEDPEGRKAALGRWGETLTLLPALLTDAEQCKELLQALGSLSSNLALRALPDVDALSRAEILDLLVGNEGWDGDDLLFLLNGWRARGASPTEVLEILQPRLVPARGLEEAGAYLYAIEASGLPLPAEAFFEAWGRPRRANRPADLGIEMASIPGGVFLMGAGEHERERWEDELSRHEVAVPTFEMARVPVTLGQLALLTGEDPSPEEARLPATRVSWYAARLFCRWVGGRLPSEAEWEYACRAGTTTRYWAGDAEDDLHRVAWYDRNSGGRAHPVGEKPANPFGLHDVHGNVWEWCEDAWSSSYDASRSSHPGPYRRPDPGAGRVFRGGSWGYDARYCRSAYRDGRHPGGRDPLRGFRVAGPASPSS